MEKSRIKIGPNAKLGNDSPNKLNTLMVRSSQRFFLRAERTPAGMDSNNATNKAEAVSSNVYQLSEEELADIEDGLREIERGEVASDAEVKGLFSRLRR